MANIDANEIARQANRVKEQTVNCTQRILQIVENLDYISGQVISEDSSLSNEIKQLSQIYTSLEKKIYTNFRSVSDVMENYAKKSLQINETITQEVKSSNANLDSINSALNSMGAPEIYVDFD